MFAKPSAKCTYVYSDNFPFSLPWLRLYTHYSTIARINCGYTDSKRRVVQCAHNNRSFAGCTHKLSTHKLHTTPTPSVSMFLVNLLVFICSAHAQRRAAHDTTCLHPTAAADSFRIVVVVVFVRTIQVVEAQPNSRDKHHTHTHRTSHTSHVQRKRTAGMQMRAQKQPTTTKV